MRRREGLLCWCGECGEAEGDSVDEEAVGDSSSVDRSARPSLGGNDGGRDGSGGASR